MIHGSCPVSRNSTTHQSLLFSLNISQGILPLTSKTIPTLLKELLKVFPFSLLPPVLDLRLNHCIPTQMRASFFSPKLVPLKFLNLFLVVVGLCCGTVFL